MKFEEKSFSSRPASDEYRANWEATFGKKEESAKREICDIVYVPPGQKIRIPCRLAKGHAGRCSVFLPSEIPPMVIFQYCGFELPPRSIYDIHHNTIGTSHGQRCGLRAGHEGNHQMEAY